jgi:putative ABC transport system permease protein
MNTLANAATLARAYLLERPLATALNVLLMGLGTGMIIALLLVLSQVEQRMARDTAGIDLVVGAKGSPTQLILSSVFHLDVPTGNVPQAEAEAVLRSPMVRRAIPLALGDSYRSFRIVGTRADYLDLYGATLAAGKIWGEPLEAVVGAEVARATGLGVGQSFAGAHGLSDGAGAHENHPYRVVGVLLASGTVIDRLILTSLESVWQLHEHGIAPAGEHAEDREVTAYLVQYATPTAAAGFPRRVNAASRLQAASPAMETARLFSLIGVGVTALKSFALVMTLCAALGIFIGLTNALDEMRADLALLRVLGAPRATVFLTIMAQGLALGVAGVILGVLLGHAGAAWMAASITAVHHLPLSGLVFLREEGLIVAGTIGLALFAALLPACIAYRQALPESLNRA